MSFNRLPYDNCSYKQVLKETTGPGFYHLTTPPTPANPVTLKTLESDYKVLVSVLIKILI